MATEKPELNKVYNTSYVNPLDAARSKGHVLTISRIDIPSAAINMTAFLDQWSDSFTSNWNRETVYGRMDTIQNFQNTQRSISVSFKLVAASKSEAKKNLRNVSQMVQFLYPSFKGLADGITNAYTINGAPVVSVKYMNLITEQDGGALAGTLDGLDHSFDMEGGFFEEYGQVYPKILNLSFTFHPLHKATQGYVNGKSLNDGFPYKNSGYVTDPPKPFDVAQDNPESTNELNGGQSIPPEIQESQQEEVLGSGLGQSMFIE